MRNLSRAIVLCVFLLHLSIFSTQAAISPDVVINEIAWMGTTNSANDEWVELYNNTDNSINLDGWQLVAQDGTPKITLSGLIPVNGFYLLERTNEDTVPGISADKIYTGALENSGENLKLYDNLNNIVDEVNCSEKWLAGDSAAKQTMEKTSTGWQTSENPGGTPKSQNSAGAVVKTETIPIETIVYPNGIIFNEILPSPTGADEKEEWIEIFNQNDFEVNISNWKITDVAGKTETYAFPQITKIPAQGFLVLSRPTSKITLNNDEDGLLLIQPNGNILDNVDYQKAPQGQSYNKAESNWVWSSVLTPASKNILTQPDIKKEVEEKSKTETQKLKVSPETKSQLASIGEQIPKSSKFFLIALGLAIFSGVIILFLKMKLNPVRKREL